MAEFGRLVEFRHANNAERTLIVTLAPVEENNFVSFTGPASGIVLNVEVHKAGQVIVAAQFLDNKWCNRVEFPIPPGQNQHIQFRLRLRRTGIEISVGDLLTGDWPISDAVTKISRAEGVGNWSFEELDHAGQDGKPSEIPVFAAPDRSLAREFHSNLIFDIGAHNGDDADYYLAKGFRVVSIDANPVLASGLLSRFPDAIEQRLLSVLNVGIAPTRGNMKFYVNKINSEWSSFDRSIASRGHPVEEVVVRTITPQELFDSFGTPYYVKIDIEGFDHLVIDAIAKNAVRPDFVSFENGDIRSMRRLADAGYRRFILVNQAKVREFQLPPSSREGKSIAYRFRPGSSGPFGRDLAGRWLGADDMEMLLHQHFREAAVRPASVTGEWYDLHASMSELD